MRLGIAGPGGVTSGGSGDTYFTDAITVAADNAWHALTFNVLPGNFTAASGTNISAALANVTQFRILHNPDDAFIGASVEGAFFLDNIRAIGAAGLAGDYNGNHIVDGADYVIWRNTLGQTGSGLAADGTGPGGVPDGVVNNLDDAFWRARFGNMGSGSGSSLGAGSIPEPGAGLILGALSCVLRRKSRRDL
jgi:hypothetical protein